MSPNYRRRPKVLIVDDERVIADTVAIVLSKSGGCECSTAYNGWEGLRKARELKPDMIITGVCNGDDLNGIDMAIQIHAEIPGTKICLFSGQRATADLLNEAIAKGHSFLTSLPILPKPAHPQELLNLVRLHLNPDAVSE